MSKQSRKRNTKIVRPQGQPKRPKNSVSSAHVRTRARASSKIVGRNPSGTSTDEWYTPKWLIQALGNDFELDPCAPLRRWHTAGRCYTEADDGLRKDWGTQYVFVNPPYSDIEPWMDKLSAHQNGIALVFPRTDTDWMQNYGLSAELALFIDKRLKFVRGERKADGSIRLTNAQAAPAPSVLLAFGDRAVRAVARSFLAEQLLYGRLVKGFEPSDVYHDILGAPNDPAIFANWPDFRS